MKTFKQLIQAAALAAAALASPVFAQSAADMTNAEVRKVDKESRKITLKHESIKSLDMPAMTMVFQVGDASMLDMVKAGDKVRFTAANEAGKLTLTDIQPAN